MSDEKLIEWARETVGKQLGLKAKDVPASYSGVKNIAECGASLVRRCAEIAGKFAGPYAADAILRDFGMETEER